MKYFFSSLLLVAVLYSSAQADLLDSIMAGSDKKVKEYVAYTFKMTHVINGQSVEMTKKGALDFEISHRFGDAFATKADNIHNLFGFDDAADIGIVFDYGVTDDFSVGTERMKGAGQGISVPVEGAQPVQMSSPTELWDVHAKYRVLKQTTNFKIPLTIDLYGNACISSGLNSNSSSTLDYYPKGYVGFSHRWSYLVQGLIATKATNWLSLQLDPTFLWRNLVPSNDKNGLFVMGLSARAKFNKRMGIVFEYYIPGQQSGIGGRVPFAMVRGQKNAAYYPPLNIGVEFETGGHVFHVNLTNTAGLMENDFLAYNAHNWAQGQFRLGFTISRSFPLDKKHKGEKYWKKGSVEDPDPKATKSTDTQIVK
jgi:hypothetical protein